MKKIAKILTVIMTAVFLLCSCGEGQNKEDGRLKIVATVFPQYDWIREIAGELFGEAEVTLLVSNGTDLHSYQPSASDMIKISDCDIFVYVGGESDAWVENVLKEAKNKAMITVDLMDVLKDNLKTEAEGVEKEKDEEDEDGEYDEHVWLSLKNAKTACESIAFAMDTADPENKETYDKNLKAYEEKLDKLNGEYEQAVKNGRAKTLIFADRFPFRYLLDDYGLEFFAAFSGCSAETEASFETVVFLADKADELKLDSLIILENSDGSVAKAVRENTAGKNQQILVMDSMQSMTLKDIEEGVTYLLVMENNLKALEKALG